MDEYTANEQAYKNGYAQGCKDTAEKYTKEVLDFIHYETFRKGFELKKVENKVKELAKQYGIEVEQ